MKNFSYYDINEKCLETLLKLFDEIGFDKIILTDKETVVKNNIDKKYE